MVANRFQEANGLTGNPECIDPRLWFLGEKEVEADRVACLLALLNGATSVVNLLGSLPVCLPSRYHRFAVFCPSYRPSLDEARQLEKVGVNLSQLDLQDPLVLVGGAMEMCWASAPNAVGFEHSDDYHWVKWRGREFTPTPRQAEVVRILHQAWRGGRPALSWRAISARMVDPGERLRDIFKGSPLWGTLVVWPRRGVYQLDI